MEYLWKTRESDNGNIYIIHSFKSFFGTKKCVFRDNLEIVFEIIFIGFLLVMYIDFHADLISNSAIPTLLGTPCTFILLYIFYIYRFFSVFGSQQCGVLDAS